MNPTNNTSYSIEAEQSVIGGLLLDNSKIAEVCLLIGSNDFFDERNGVIFEAILKLANEKKAFDILIVLEILQASKDLEKAGGESYVFSIANNTPTTSNVLEYAKIVKQKSINRAAILCAEQLKQNPQDIDGIISQLEKLNEMKFDNRNYPPPISLETTDLPKLPHNIPLSWFGEMIEAVSAATETPREMVFLVGLGVLAASCQKKFIVSPEEGYTEQLCIWVCPIAEVSERKSAVIAKMTLPLIDWELQKAEEIKPEIVLKKSLRLTFEKKINFLRKKAAVAKSSIEADKLQQEIFDMEKEIPEIPSVPRIWTQDVTPEKAALLSAENGGKISAISAEGGLIDTLAGRYSNNIPNLDFFLQSYSGDSVRVDRMGRDPVFINNPAMTLCLLAQPDILRSLNSRHEFKGRGLLARFLFAMPKSMVGRRTLEHKPIPDHVKINYHRAVHNLLNIKSDNSKTLTFSPDAYKEWKAFALFIERESRDGGKFEYAKDIAGKLAGTAARLAGLFHCINFADNAYFADVNNQIISLENMKTALLVLSIFIEHSLAVMQLMGLDSKQKDALRILRWINTNKQKQFTARDCFNSLRGCSTFKHMDAINDTLEVLVENFYVFKLDNNKQNCTGRPASQKFIVSHYLTEKW